MIASKALPALQEGLGGGDTLPGPFPGSLAQLPMRLASKGLPRREQGSHVVYVLLKIHSWLWCSCWHPQRYLNW